MNHRSCKIESGRKPARNGFTIIEALIVVFITAVILLFAYRLFFSQTRMVTQSISSSRLTKVFAK